MVNDSDTFYVLDQEQMDQLRSIANFLCGGSDKMRDQGNYLHCLITGIVPITGSQMKSAIQ